MSDQSTKIRIAKTKALRPNYLLTEFARAAAATAIDLCDRMTFLSVTGAPGEDPDILVWDDRLKALSYDQPDGPSRRIKATGRDLIGYLAGRWPPGAAPLALGFITDGMGVAFSPGHPSPEAPGWMERHAIGAPRPVAILPFLQYSPCALLFDSDHRLGH